MEDEDGGVVAGGEHVAPGGIGFLNAKADETEDGFGDDEAGDGEGGGNDDVGGGLRQDVAEDDVERSPAHGLRGLDEGSFFEGEDFASNDSC